MDIEELLNDGDTEELKDIIKKYFNGDSELFFNYVIDEGLSSKEKFDTTLAELFPIQYLNYYYYNVSKDAVKKYVSDKLSDVIEEDGKYYMILDDISELSEFFDSGRNSAGQKYIESVLSGDADYYTDMQNIGSDLVDDLTPENKQRLIEKIKEDGLNKEIEFNGSDDLIESFIEADGNSSTFILTTERLNQIIAQRDGLYELLSESDNFEELKDEMNRFFNWAHDQASVDKIYEKTIGEIAAYFRVSPNELGKWRTINITRYNGSVVAKEQYLVNADKIFEDAIESSIADVSYWDEDNRLIDYHGGLESYLKDETRLPSLYLDYVHPDWNNLKEIYNSHFSDNI